jgi:hypothetical protein
MAAALVICAGVIVGLAILAPAITLSAALTTTCWKGERW